LSRPCSPCEPAASSARSRPVFLSLLSILALSSSPRRGLAEGWSVPVFTFVLVLLLMFVLLLSLALVVPLMPAGPVRVEPLMALLVLLESALVLLVSRPDIDGLALGLETAP